MIVITPRRCPLESPSRRQTAATVVGAPHLRLNPATLTNAARPSESSEVCQGPIGMVGMSIVSSLCGCLVSVSPNGTELYAEESRQQEARSLAHALLTHDLTLRSMEWHERTLIRDASAEQLVVLNESDQGMDEWGRWYSHGSVGYRNQLGEMSYYRVHYAFDGQIVQTFNEANNSGLIRPLETELRSMVAPFLMLGRAIDFTTYRRLGQLLLDTDSLRLSTPVDAGIATLSASLQLNGKPAVLEVEVDTRHGFAPRAIRRYDDVWGILKEEIVASKFELHSGVWIPTNGHRTSFAVDDRDAQRTAALNAELSRVALSERQGLSHMETHALFRAAIRTVFGPEGAHTVPIGEGRYDLEITSITAVNETMADGKFEITYPTGALVVDVYTGTGNVMAEAQEEGQARDGAPD